MRHENDETKEEKIMEKEYLIDILESLFLVRDGLLDDLSKTHAAYHLGMLIASLEITLEELEEYEEKQNDFGHT